MKFYQKETLCFITSIFTAFLLVVLFIPSSNAENDFAYAIDVIGTAEIFIDTSEISLPLKKNAKIFSGSIIKVARGSLVKLLLPDSHTVTLGPAATTVKWYKGRLNAISIVLYRGQVFNSVNKLNQRNVYRVVTPTSVSGVRGTEFKVLVGDDNSSKIEVNEGTVLSGKEEMEAELTSGDETEFELIDKEYEESESNWFDKHKIKNADEAALLEARTADDMKATNKFSLQDFAEIAALTPRIVAVASRPPQNAGDADAILDLLLKGLAIWQQAEIRKEAMDARITGARTISAEYGISSENSDSEYQKFLDARSSKAESLEKFISLLEKLSSLLKVSKVTSSPIGGLLKRLPW